MGFNVRLEDVQSLLASRQLAEAQEEVVAALNARLLPARFATPYQREMLVAEVSVEEVKRLLSEELELLIRFTLLHLSVPEDRDSKDGDFPEGEEPDPDDRSQTLGTLGYESGFLITHAIYIALARRGREKLTAYLKSRRIPRAAKVCEEFLAHHARASSGT